MHLDFSIKSDLSNVTLHQIKFSQGKIFFFFFYYHGQPPVDLAWAT